MRDIINIFDIPWDIHPGIISTTENVRYLDFLVFVDIIISEIVYAKTLKLDNKFTFNLHICWTYWFGGFVPHNWEIWL